MLRGYFMGCWLIGMGAAAAVFFSLKAKRRACIPPVVWWLCLVLGAVACIYGLFHSTAPSFAPRITAVGRAYEHIERHQGRDTYYGFRFVPDGGEPVNIETEIILPGWANPAIFNGRTFRVIYLDNNKRALKNEAIDIEILSGRDTGFHDSLDARPVGDWLGIPLGAGLGAFGFLGLKYKKDDATSAASDDPRPRMEYTEQQKVEFKERFNASKKRQYILSGLMIAIFLPLFAGKDQASILGLPAGVYATLTLVAVLLGLAFSFRNWRCPACDRYLGNGSISPRFCQKCGVPLA